MKGVGGQRTFLGDRKENKETPQAEAVPCEVSGLILAALRQDDPSASTILA